MEGKMKVNANVFINHIRNGKIIDRREVHNIVVNSGKAAMSGLFLADVGGTAFDYIAVGTGTTSPAATDTALENEVMREAATGTQVTTSVTNDTAQLEATFNFTSSYAITESGVFNASSGGTMACRTTFSAINVSSGDSLQITWKIQFQ